LRESILSSINLSVKVGFGKNRFDFSMFSEAVVVTFEAGFRVGRRTECNASEEAWGGG
jgi:hypothetical protein